jgi:hypothetical protein
VISLKRRMNPWTTTSRRPLAVLDRPRRHLHRRRRARPDGALVTHKLLSENPSVQRRRRAGHPRPAGTRAGDPIPPRRSRGEDGHHGGHQRAAGAQGRPHLLLVTTAASRRAAHRLPEPPAPVRPPHRAAGAALRARRRGRRAGRRRRRGAHAARPRGRPRGAEGRLRRRHPRRRHRLHARLPLPDHERGGAIAREIGFTQVSVSATRSAR